MIEGLLLTIALGVTILLMHSLSRKLKPSETRSLGIFSYIDKTVNKSPKKR